MYKPYPCTMSHGALQTEPRRLQRLHADDPLGSSRNVPTKSNGIDRTDQRIGLLPRGWPRTRAPQRRYYELHLDERGTGTWRRWRRSTTSNCLCRIHQTACSLFISLSGFRRLRARARGPARARSQPGRRKATSATENDLSSPQTAVVRMWTTYKAAGRRYPAWLLPLGKCIDLL